ncbi:zinc ribbon domain-containing protein [Micromonospora sp. SL1-18]|uniref:zinc ribbon domain-containing protein n=1 Tax=Micromonospora sp. SL1-18 TaxID=3399128 RepID=UPI003A4DEF28
MPAPPALLVADDAGQVSPARVGDGGGQTPVTQQTGGVQVLLTSAGRSTCPACLRRVPKPRERTLSCPHCEFVGHRDLVAAAIIATRSPGGGPTTPTATVVLPEVVTHRRAGRHLPGAGRSRRDPRRPARVARGSVGLRRPAPPPPGDGESLAHTARIHNSAPATR